MPPEDEVIDSTCFLGDLLGHHQAALTFSLSSIYLSPTLQELQDPRINLREARGMVDRRPVVALAKAGNR